MFKRLTMEQTLDMVGKIGGTVAATFFAVWTWADVELIAKLTASCFAVFAGSFTIISCWFTIKRHKMEIARLQAEAIRLKDE